MSQHPILKEETITVRSLEDDFYADEFEDYGDIEDSTPGSAPTDSPIVSHTLIDLYCAQQYFDKAIELLEKIIELNPDDLVTAKKLHQVLEMKMNAHAKLHVVVTEEDGHDELISIIENQVKAKSPRELKLQDTFDHFLTALKDRAQQHR